MCAWSYDWHPWMPVCAVRICVCVSPRVSVCLCGVCFLVIDLKSVGMWTHPCVSAPSFLVSTFQFMVITVIDRQLIARNGQDMGCPARHQSIIYSCVCSSIFTRLFLGICLSNSKQMNWLHIYMWCGFNLKIKVIWFVAISMCECAEIYILCRCIVWQNCLTS